MEWKASYRTAYMDFDRDDRRWVEQFTLQSPDALGYLVSVSFAAPTVEVHAGRAVRGNTEEFDLHPTEE
jgi:hypothetical protein